MHALWCALLLVSLVFGEVFFGGSASLHNLFLHFLAKCFFCNFRLSFGRISIHTYYDIILFAHLPFIEVDVLMTHLRRQQSTEEIGKR